MNFGLKKIIAYAIGVLIILLWAVFHIFTYDVAMMITSFVLIGCFAIEAQEAKQLHRVISYRIRLGCMGALVFALVCMFIKIII